MEIACMIHFGVLKGFFLGLLVITFGWAGIGFVEFVWISMVALLVRALRGTSRDEPVVIIDPEKNLADAGRSNRDVGPASNVLLREYREASPLVERCGEEVAPQDLETDVVGAGVAMVVDTSEHRAFVAVYDHRVTEALGATSNEVLLGETESSPTILVVVEPGVDLEVLVRSAQVLLARLAEYDRLLDADELVLRRCSARAACARA
jgi:hypothetical protein